MNASRQNLGGQTWLNFTSTVTMLASSGLCHSFTSAGHEGGPAPSAHMRIAIACHNMLTRRCARAAIKHRHVALVVRIARGMKRTANSRLPVRRHQPWDNTRCVAMAGHAVARSTTPLESECKHSTHAYSTPTRVSGTTSPSFITGSVQLAAHWRKCAQLSRCQCLNFRCSWHDLYNSPILNLGSSLRVQQTGTG